MNKPALILYLEDNPRDAELVRDKLLQQTGMECEVRVARDRAEYEAALSHSRFDLILSDYSLPDYDGMAALELACAQQPDVPFIIISGTLGEEKAVECLLRGATDYLLKDRLERLAPAVMRALAEAGEKQRRREMEKALIESEAKYRSIFENSIMGISQALPDGRLISANQSYAEMFGYANAAEMFFEASGVGQRYANQDARQEVLRILSEKGVMQPREITVVRRDGSQIVILVAAREIRDSAGNLLCYQSEHLDITERKRAEEAQRTSEACFSTVFRVSPISIAIARLKDGVFIDVNGAWEKVTGFTREEAVGRKGVELNIWVDAGQRELLIRNMRERGDIHEFEVQMRQKSGVIRDILISAEQIDFAGEPCMLTMAMDITERKQAENDLRESKDLFQAVVENVPLMIFLKEATDLRFVIFNRAGEELLGYDREALLGKNNLDLFPPEQAAHFMAKDREVLDGEAGMLDILEESIETAKKGQRLLHTRKVCILGNDGGKKYLLGISEDITDRKRAEEEKSTLEAQLQQAQKMESVGRLAGGVAHDFNNMLVVILGHAELAMKRPDLSPPLLADLEAIRSAAERSANLTRQLLAFARKQTIAPEVLDLNEALAGMLKMLQRLIGEDIHLVWQPGVNPWQVKVDPSQVDQILANLCVNARDAIADTGMITIVTENFTFDDAYCASYAGYVAGEYVSLAVSDNGCGMDKEMLSHIFEPFFSTKEVGKGTGLGLSTVYGIVKQNNGFINVYSEPGQGTTFTIYLPRHLGNEEKSQLKAAPKTALSGEETILLVEDEPALLELTTGILTLSGYSVLAANSPGEAIRLADEHAGEIHLLMTDVVMPGMNGRDLANNLLSRIPYLKRLFMSGYTANVIAHHGVLDEGVHFIQKPFSMQNLAAKVREVLDSGK